MQRFADWIGRTSESDDVVTDRLLDSFRAIFDPCLAPTPDGLAPPGLHWCLAPSIAPMAELGPDGHPVVGGGGPPRSRMWAGGWVETIDPLRAGDHVRRISTVREVTRKDGRSGELWFVAVYRDYLTERGLAIRERHDIVYREAGGLAPRPLSERRFDRTAEHSFRIETSPTLLFRYSAITFNGHRIHYDHPYATEVEGYAGLVVHAPLQATLLLNLASMHGVPRRFGYRGVAPAIAGAALTVCAGSDGRSLWAQGVDGGLSMTAEIDTEALPARTAPARSAIADATTVH